MNDQDYVVIVNPGGRIDAVDVDHWDAGDGVNGLMHRSGFRKATTAEVAEYDAYVARTSPQALAKLNTPGAPVEGNLGMTSPERPEWMNGTSSREPLAKAPDALLDASDDDLDGDDDDTPPAATEYRSKKGRQ